MVSISSKSINIVCTLSTNLAINYRINISKRDNLNNNVAILNLDEYNQLEDQLQNKNEISKLEDKINQLEVNNKNIQQLEEIHLENIKEIQKNNNENIEKINKSNNENINNIIDEY